MPKIRCSSSLLGFLFEGSYENIIIISVFLTAINFVNAEVQQQNWIVFTNEETWITKATINVIIEDQDSIIWIGTGEDGLLKYDAKAG